MRMRATVSPLMVQMEVSPPISTIPLSIKPVSLDTNLRNTHSPSI